MYGGIEAMLHTFATTAPPEVKHEFALCFDGRLAQELRAADHAPHMLGEMRMRSPLSIWRARRRLAALAQNKDLTIFHAPWVMGLLGPALPEQRRIFWAHDTWNGTHPVERLTRRAKPRLIIANSDYTRGTLLRHFGTHQIPIVRYPVGPGKDFRGERNATRQAMGISDREIVVVMAARLEEWKGHRLLIEAIAHAQEPGLRVWVIGGPQKPNEKAYLEDLERRCQVLGISNQCQFLGQRDDVGRWLAAADIHCQPNIGPEPFGVVFIEALYAGLPIVTTRMGAAMEIVNDEAGILVNPNNAKALAQALDDLAADPERRAAFAASAPRRADELCNPAKAHAALRRFSTGGQRADDSIH